MSKYLTILSAFLAVGLILCGCSDTPSSALPVSGAVTEKSPPSSSLSSAFTDESSGSNALGSASSLPVHQKSISEMQAIEGEHLDIPIADLSFAQGLANDEVYFLGETEGEFY